MKKVYRSIKSVNFIYYCLNFPQNRKIYYKIFYNINYYHYLCTRNQNLELLLSYQN
jgi:hypothetical protein